MTFHPARPLAELFATRTSIKWRRFPMDVLPMFVAEMDFDIEEAILERVHSVLAYSDTGYLEAPGELADAFADFALSEWKWRVETKWIHLATDVTVGIVETLRLALPPSQGRVVITSPVYPPFFEMIDEVNARCIDVPLAEAEEWSLDLPRIAAEFAHGVDAMILCNPHNPTGRCHSRESLEELAKLAAQWNVLVISDEVHAPLAHPGAAFTPFARVAVEAGARAITVTSASKGWNLAGLKCALIVAATAESAQLLKNLPDELAARTSILGLHANTAAFSCLQWRDAAIQQIVSNIDLLTDGLSQLAPEVHVVRPTAGYLAWLDFRDTTLGEDPALVLREKGRIALNSGRTFGNTGAGFARINLACDPSTVREGTERIARTVSSGT